MKDWSAVAERGKKRLATAWTRLKKWSATAWGRLKEWATTAWARLKKWSATAWTRLRGWLHPVWTRFKEWLRPAWSRLAAWVKAHRERLVPSAAFLGVSLGVFLALALSMPSPAQRVGQRYLDAAFSYDYMGLYNLLDPQVLEGELDRYGLDRGSMAALAQTNHDQLARYVADIESRYGVKISFAPTIEAQRPLERAEEEALEGRYAADGIHLDIRAARRLRGSVYARLEGAGQVRALRRELELTAIATPQGWSLERDSMLVFLDVIYALPGAAQGDPGT